jgi:hypothetical protein
VNPSCHPRARWRGRAPRRLVSPPRAPPPWTLAATVRTSVRTSSAAAGPMRGSSAADRSGRAPARRLRTGSGAVELWRGELRYHGALQLLLLRPRPPRARPVASARRGWGAVGSTSIAGRPEGGVAGGARPAAEKEPVGWGRECIGRPEQGGRWP